MDATTFPISFTYHLVFTIVACIFFIVQYVRTQKSYRLLMAIGIPASLCIYIQPENHSLFAAVGAFEAVLLIGAVVFAIIEKKERKQDAEAKQPLPDIETPAAPKTENTEESQPEAEE